MRISDWSSDVCSSDLLTPPGKRPMTIVAHEKRRASAGIGRSQAKAGRYFDQPTHDRTRTTSSHIAAKNSGKPIAKSQKNGRASCREREVQYVELSVGAVSLKKKKNKNNQIEKD